MYINCTRYAILNFHISRGFYYRMTWAFTMKDFRNLVPWLLVFTGMRSGIHRGGKVIISFDAELPFELVWGTQKMSKNVTGTTWGGGIWQEMAWIGWSQWKGWFLRVYLTLITQPLTWKMFFQEFPSAACVPPISPALDCRISSQDFFTNRKWCQQIPNN